MNPQPRARGHSQGQIKELLAERRLHPRSSLGQCFLIDLNLVDILVQRAELDADDFVLEVGAGTGSLTQRLAASARSVLSVEIDPNLCEIAQDTVRSSSNVVLLCTDVLRNKNTLSPAVIAAITELAPMGSLLKRKLIANLPYSVATPVISLLLTSEWSWDRLVVTIQKELADRLMASPGTKDYGSLSVLVQALAEVERVRELSPTVFWPPPQVSSAMVAIVPSPSKRAAIRDLATFCDLVRGVMLHRRKNLRGAMSAWLPDVPKKDIAEFLLDLSVDPHCRAESLAVAEFLRIAERLPARWFIQSGTDRG